MVMEMQQIGLAVPEIMLPPKGTDLGKWAVVACDQYSSQPEYWQKVDEFIGDSPSTLRLTLPEVYLDTPDEEKRIAAINRTMEKYTEDGTLLKREPGFVLVDRKTSHAPSRKGLVVALDLECYDYRQGSDTLIRATEGTIVDRLPPRIKVREKAPVELPHIMVLIDDPEKTVIEPLFEKELELLYDFDLMMESGHISGRLVKSEEDIAQVASALAKLASPTEFSRKYGVGDNAPLLYAMGDGNHSFATAKAIWEKLKSESEDKDALMSHPARWALAELVNLHDQGLQFEPIHRVVFNTDPQKLLEAFAAFHREQGAEITIKDMDADADPQQALRFGDKDAQVIPFVLAGSRGVIEVRHPAKTLVVATLQDFLDNWLKETGCGIDYIHGNDVVTELGSKPGNIGFYLPAIDKSGLFRTIILDGALPRKTFSMGEADEKRFYLEARKIR